MIVLWRQTAAEDLDAILAHIEESDERAAYKIMEAVVAASFRLSEFPNRGRPGRAAGTRELTVAKKNVLVYEVDDDADEVSIRRVWHIRQNR